MRELHQQRSTTCPLQSNGISEALTLEIPDDAIFTIFLKLPINTLVRFCSVSKKFREIIISSSFVNQHMRSLRESKSSCSVIYSQKFLPGFRVCRISSEGYGKQLLLPAKTPFDHDDDFSFFMPAEYHSCNGLICLAEIILGVGSTVSVFSSLIWNPATRKHRKVIWPLLSEKSYGNYLNTYMGFGYEAKTDDYKIVLLFSDHGSGKWIAYVMSFNEDKWETVDLSSSPCVRDVFGFDISCQMSSVSVNGVLYWIARHFSTKCYCLLKFNLADESFNVVLLPEGTPAMCFNVRRKLATYDGLLYLFVCGIDLAFNDRYKVDIWMLRGGTTWCKVSTLPTKENILYPLGFNLSGHIIMVNCFDKSLVVYIPQENRFMKLNVNHVYNEPLSLHFVQMETLVSP